MKNFIKQRERIQELMQRRAFEENLQVQNIENSRISITRDVEERKKLINNDNHDILMENQNQMLNYQ